MELPSRSRKTGTSLTNFDARFPCTSNVQNCIEWSNPLGPPRDSCATRWFPFAVKPSTTTFKSFLSRSTIRSMGACNRIGICAYTCFVFLCDAFVVSRWRKRTCAFITLAFFFFLISMQKTQRVFSRKAARRPFLRQRFNGGLLNTKRDEWCCASSHSWMRKLLGESPIGSTVKEYTHTHAHIIESCTHHSHHNHPQ
jgi:hypothetical protein